MYIKCQMSIRKREYDKDTYTNGQETKKNNQCKKYARNSKGIDFHLSKKILMNNKNYCVQG